MNTPKMLTTSSAVQKNSVLIVQGDGNKFYSRLLSKESSVANPSFRVYYGVASGSVPFLWESQPGTPKHVSSGTALPPLTPPPSYYSTTRSKSTPKLKSSKSFQLIHTILPRLSLRKNGHATSPSSPLSVSLSSASSVSSSSSFSSAASARRRRRWSSSTRLSFSFSREEEDDNSDAGSPTSRALCFGGALGRFYSAGLMKNAFMSIGGGRRSRHGAAA